MDRKKQIVRIRWIAAGILVAVPLWLFILAGRQIDIDRNLLLAIRRNDAPTVEFLLSAGADANTRDSPQDARPMLRQILDRLRGIPVPPGNSALLVHLGRVPDKNKPSGPWIALPENIAIARTLLDHHADPNARRDESKTTPLMCAAKEGQESTVRLLLARGAKVGLTDSQGTDALHFAAESGSVECVRLLLDAGADVNSRDSLRNVPLMNAVSNGNIPIVKLLIARGADVSAEDSAEEPVLTYAMRVHSRPIIALLKAAGAK